MLLTTTAKSYKCPCGSLGTPAAERLGRGARGWHGHRGLGYGTDLPRQPLLQLGSSHPSPAAPRLVGWERKSIPKPS